MESLAHCTRGHKHLLLQRGYKKLSNAVIVQRVLEYQRTNDQQAAEDVVRAFLPLICRIARKWLVKETSLEDLVSAGACGVLDAMRRFDLERGNLFFTVAFNWVRNYIANESSRAEFGKPIRIDKLRRYRMAKKKCLDVLRSEALAASFLEEEETSFSSSAQFQELLPFLSRLSAREQYVLLAYHGLIKQDSEPSLSTVGKVLGVSKERVRQIKDAAILKVRKAIHESQSLCHRAGL